MRKTKCVGCGCDIVVDSVRGPMPSRCPACRKKRMYEQKRSYDEMARRAGRKTRRRTESESMSRKSLDEMSPVRRRIEMRRRANRDYYSFCPMP